MPTPTFERRLILFGRYPVPGCAKTRLIPPLGPLGAADLHRRLSEQTLAVLMRSYQAPVDVAYTGGTRSQLHRWLNPGRVKLYPQAEGDLGRRMQWALQQALDQGVRQVVLVGTDVPGLTPRHLVDAFQALNQYDVVLGPSVDGGYWLIGCRRPVQVFQGIDWGTPLVLEQTLGAAERTGVSVALLEPALQDIDTEQDLRRWRPQEKSRPYLSVVIPTLNERERIGQTVASIRSPHDEVIVVDGGSRDGTVEAAQQAGAKVILAPRGRARQQNAGAAAAAGRVLLFLHADTLLPRSFGAQIFELLLDHRVTLGAFRFHVDWDHPAMRWIEWGAQVRSRLLHLPYGDQAFFMRKEDFEHAGGFPEAPFAEDLLLAHSIARRGRVELAPGVATTSGRRWRSVGIGRLTLMNILIAGTCLAGIDPRFMTSVHRYGQRARKSPYREDA